MDDDDEADEIMKDEACDSLHTFPATASELHLTPVDFPRNPIWTRTLVRLPSSGSGVFFDPESQTSRMGPGIHGSISPSSKFQPSEAILVPNTDSRGKLTPLPALHFPPKWTGLDEPRVGDASAELDDEETEVSACMRAGLG